MNRFKKVAATILITLFAMGLISGSTSKVPVGSRAEAIGRLAGLVILLAGLFYSTRWRLKLSGRKHKVGRQAFAVLWCCESVLGVLLGLAFLRSVGILMGSVVIVIWSLSFWLTYRWLINLRKEELMGVPA